MNKGEVGVALLQAEIGSAFQGGVGLDMESLNLVEFPLALLARTTPQGGQKVVVFRDHIQDRGAGRRLERTLTISANADSELPNWWDQDVVVALQVLTWRKNRFASEVVEFSIYEVLQLMQLKNSTKNRRRVAKALDNLQGLRFKYSHWREGDSWRHPEAFCLLQDYNLSRVGRRDPAEPQVFAWGRKVFESIREEKGRKRFDADFYFSLNLPTSRRMFRFIDKRFWQGRQGFDYNLVNFCIDKLGMSGGYKPSQYPRKLQPAYNELVQRGFLEDLAVEERHQGTRRDWRIHVRRKRNKKRQKQPLLGKPAKGQVGLIRELVARGIRPVGLAEKLVENPSDWEGDLESWRRFVRSKLDCLDWLVERNDKRVCKNPLGFLRSSIEQRWGDPPEMKVAQEAMARKLKARKKQKKERETTRALRQRERVAAEECRERFLSFWNALPLEEKAQFEALAVDKSSRYARRGYEDLHREHSESGLVSPGRNKTTSVGVWVEVRLSMLLDFYESEVLSNRR